MGTSVWFNLVVSCDTGPQSISPSVFHESDNNQTRLMIILFAPVFAEYQKISGRDIEDSIKREMSGCLEDVFLAIGVSLLQHKLSNTSLKKEHYAVSVRICLPEA